MTEAFLSAELAALLQVLFIDVVLAGDNAVVVGMAAAGVDPAIRRRVIFWGIGGAVVLRILFALVAVQLLAIVGLTLAGGILLLWVCWKMFREIRAGSHEEEEAAALANASRQHKTFGQAMLQIIIADVSMSLDNVLAVAGAAQDHVEVLVVGLLISVVLMGAAATLIANVLNKYRFIAWIGLAVILFVALRMIYHGWDEVACYVQFLSSYCLAEPVAGTTP
ncbi:TerC family protein [Aureimonas jatrophae]|uniref:Integral membrane protein, YjbE family n=1 Tax=Aureimonas jatrophae TaxID=1166073 RepID=A0A1H0GQQ4_9HYPH|nr:TerC family protein [Aureimonas jatrophae]MBB3949710.1 YjbE family integral membrane protein [Aureimonas jatrophae]SDO09207.1 integral membrane protein, YjbE family [Aureimonas jatrophae]